MIHRIGTTIGAFLRIAIIIVCYVWVALAPKRNGAGDGQLIWYYISSRGESLISTSQFELHHHRKNSPRQNAGNADTTRRKVCKGHRQVLCGGCGVRQMHCCRLQCSAQRYVRKGIHAAERLLFGGIEESVKATSPVPSVWRLRVLHI